MTAQAYSPSLLLVADVLEQVAVPYALGGSWASTIHEKARFTNDADFLVALTTQHIAEFIAALADDFYVDPDAARQAVADSASFNIINFNDGVKIDIFVAGKRPFNEQQLARRIAAAGDKSIWILSPEDIILSNLDWLRLGGEVSERQWHDVPGVMKHQGATLDCAYLEHWAAQLGVLDLLELAEASLD